MQVQTVGEKIQAVAQRWFLCEPLLFALYCTQVTEENRDLLLPMRCGKGKIEYNPKLLENASVNEVEDYLKLEVLRIILKHPYQRQPYNAREEILYLASNMTILDSIGKSAFSFDVVPDELVEMLPKKKTFEEYYGLLNRLLPPQLIMKLIVKFGGGSLDDGESLNGELSEELLGVLSKFCNLNINAYIQGAGLWTEDGLAVVEINEKIVQVMNSSINKGRGTLPSDFIDLVEASLVPAINVVNLLKNFKKSVLSQRRNLTRMRPSRRYGFEQMGSKYAYITNILVAIDVSGSVDNYMLSYMLGMVNRIFKQGIAAINVVQFDAELKPPVMPLTKAIKKYKVIGRGGTDFQPVADYYLEHGEYNGLIYITDGCAPLPEIPLEAKSSRPVVWIITDDDLVPTIMFGWDQMQK